jgi:hypothetical protein
MDESNENLALRIIFVHTASLRYCFFGFTSSPKEVVLQIFIAFKNPSPLPGLNPRNLGPVASTLTFTPPRRLPMSVLPHVLH